MDKNCLICKNVEQILKTDKRDLRDLKIETHFFCERTGKHFSGGGFSRIADNCPYFESLERKKEK